MVYAMISLIVVTVNLKVSGYQLASHLPGEVAFLSLALQETF